MRTMTLAALALLAGPALAQSTTGTTAAPAPAAPAAPALPPIDPARLAAAQGAVARLIPAGIYRRMMREQFPGMIDAMMTGMQQMRPSDLGLPPDKKTGDAPLGASMGAAAATMTPMIQMVMDQMGPVFDAMEPRVRTGMARAFARRFTAAQLTDLNAFFATPSGAAFASDYLLTFMDPEVMREMIAGMPEMMKAMPDIMKTLGSGPAKGKPSGTK